MTPMIMTSFCSYCEKNKKLEPSYIEMVIGQTHGWTLQTAIGVCIDIENLLEPLGFHVALTGGTLYKLGPRKDVDVMIYSHKVDKSNLLNHTEVDYIAGRVASLYHTTYSRAETGRYNDDKVIYTLGNNIDLFFPYTNF